jgi:threonine dehydrogenase-like Zn-dependent dehydrogenase
LAPIVINEVTVIGSRCGPFGPAIEALRTRKVDVRPLVAATFPIEDGVAAIDCAAEKGTLKVLLRFDS